MVADPSTVDLSAIQTTSLSGYSYAEDGGLLTVDCWEERRCDRGSWSPLGKSFTMSRLKARICTGRYSLATFKTEPCPHRAVPAATSNTCPDCFRWIGFNPFFYNVSPDAISEKQRAYNNQPHSVYLAYFGEKTVKVGISSEARFSARLLEQGAWLAVKLARCADAWAARAIEREVSGLSAITETLRNDQKRLLLAAAATAGNGSSVLRSAIFRVVRELGIVPSDSEIMDLRRFYGDFQKAEGALEGSGIRPYVISGKVLAMIGPTLVMDNGAKRVLFDIGKMVGHRFKWKPSVDSVYSSPFQERMLK